MPLVLKIVLFRAIDWFLKPNTKQEQKHINRKMRLIAGIPEEVRWGREIRRRREHSNK